MGGVIISQPETFVITYETYDGMQTLECPFDGVPASFEFVDGTYIYRWNSNMPYDLAYDTVAQAGKVFEVKINVGDGTGSPVDVSFDSFSALALATDTADSAWKMNGTCELLIDNVSVWSTTVSDSVMPTAPAWSGTVEGYFSVRYTFTSDCRSSAMYAGFTPQLLVSIPNLKVNNQVPGPDELPIKVVSFVNNDACYWNSGGTNYYPFNHFPATFDYGAAGVDASGYTITMSGDSVGKFSSGNLKATAGKYMEFIFSTGNGDLVISPLNQAYNDMFCGLYNEHYGGMSPWDKCELLVDNVVVDSQGVGKFNMTYNGTVERQFSIRFSSTTDVNKTFQTGNKDVFARVVLPYPVVTFNKVLSVPEHMTIIEGKIDGVQNVLADINTNIGKVATDVEVIKGTVVDTNAQLQNSNSGIWGAFKDSVSGLFVPSSGDLESVKNGFDQLAQDKLGGAYQTVDLVNNGVQSVVDKFKNPGSSPGVEFPGISVPLGGDVGTVTLAASQTVTIPEQITSVLYPVAGVIIPIVCVIWTIRQCTDMVECFMSGMSYAEFLHRNSDEEDDEV